MDGPVIENRGGGVDEDVHRGLGECKANSNTLRPARPFDIVIPAEFTWHTRSRPAR